MSASTASPSPGTIAVAADSPAQDQEAAALASHLRLPLSTLENPSHPLLLTVTANRLEVRDRTPGAGGAVYVDFGRYAAAMQRSPGRSHPLAKAIRGLGPPPPPVVDATAGLGKDAFRLALLGCRVRLLERDPVVAALLRDGLARAQRHHPDLHTIIARMELQEEDAIHAMALTVAAFAPALIYLDPMFPDRHLDHGKESALVKKEPRRLRSLVGEDPDADTLLLQALARTPQRVVVKRPARAPALAGPPPTYTITSGNIRMDIYLAGKTANPGQQEK